MNYSDIRKFSYKTERKVLKSMNINIDDWLYSPYSTFKIRFYIEGSCLLAFLLQHTGIKPNWITFLYAILGIAGGVLLSTGQENLIMVGVIILFSKIIVDGTDGLLARIKKKTSNLGALLDSWAGLIGEYSFLVGFGMYLFNATQEIHYVYLIILMVLAKSLDLRDYVYHYLMYTIYKDNKDNKFIQKIRKKGKKINNENQNISGNLIFLKNFFQNFLDYRGRTVDLIGLLIIIELNFDKIIITNFIYYLFFVKVIALSFGGFYLVYYKDFAKRVILKLKK